MHVKPSEHKNSESWQGEGIVGGIVPGGKGLSENTQPGVNETSSIAISPSCPSPTVPSIRI